MIFSLVAWCFRASFPRGWRDLSDPVNNLSLPCPHESLGEESESRGQSQYLWSTWLTIPYIVHGSKVERYVGNRVLFERLKNTIKTRNPIPPAPLRSHDARWESRSVNQGVAQVPNLSATRIYLEVNHHSEEGQHVSRLNHPLSTFGGIRPVFFPLSSLPEHSGDD